MKAIKEKITLEKISHLLWGLVLLTLPVTSFRYFPFLGKHTYVRPLAFYPLALLYLVLFLPLFSEKLSFFSKKTVNVIKRTPPPLTPPRTGGESVPVPPPFWGRLGGGWGEIKLPWSNALLPLWLFLIFTIFATAAGALLAPIPMRGYEYWDRALRAFITFGIGMSFFIAALWMHRDMDDILLSLKWLYAGLALTILWVGVQAIALHTPLLTKGQVSAWQELFSVRGLTKVRRTSGFAFEASWLAGQIITLYFPWLVASLIMRFRVTKNIWLEPLLFIGALASLLLTFSRGGLLIAIIATGVVLLISGKKAISRAFSWFFSPPSNSPQNGGRTSPSSFPILGKVRWGNWRRVFMLRAIIFILIIGIAWGGISFLAQQEYLTRLWSVEADSLSDYFVQINAGGRVTYLWASMQLFFDHPILGTGLGSGGLYLYQYFPDWALYNNPEIARHLSPSTQLYPNSKNLYTRLLAETGIIGFTIFFTFLLAILAQIVEALQHNKLLGIAGLYSFIAIFIYYFMQDSFAMAELWINFGIILGITKAQENL